MLKSGLYEGNACAFLENPDGSQKIRRSSILKEAEALVSELRKIGAKDKLTEEFKKRVLERGEDPGAAHLIDGYYFTEGKMVPAFEEAVKMAEMYKVTDPVETEFGLHVILRLPLEADGVLDYYTARTLRSDAAYFDCKKIESFTEMYELKE